jgi:hypothetical protein
MEKIRRLVTPELSDENASRALRAISDLHAIQRQPRESLLMPLLP